MIGSTLYRGRLAPSPTGFLHFGHARTFWIAQARAEEAGGTLILRNDDNKRTDHLFSAGLNNEFRLADRTHLYADLSYSANKRDETYIETYAGYGAGPFMTSARTFKE